MHRALRVTELLQMILECLAPRDLAAVSTTCRDISLMASDLLWEAPGSLAPLVRQLPTKFKRLEIDPITTIYLFRYDPLTAEDWAVIIRFAKRIKCFNNLTGSKSEGGRYDSVGLSVLEALCDPPYSNPLFPRLQSLHWRDRDEGIFFLPVLMSGSLKHLRFDVTPWIGEPHMWRANSTISEAYDKAASVFNDMGKHCPSLKTFVLPCDPGLADECTARCVSAIRNAVPSLKHLRHFEFDPIDINVLHHLSALPCLRTMTVTLPDELQHAEQLDDSAFPMLDCMKLQHSGSLKPCTDFLRALPRQLLLSHLSVSSHVPGGLKEFLEAVRDKCCSATLRELSINEDWENEDLTQLFAPGFNLTADDIRPSYAFRLLNNFTINTWRSVKFNDDNLLELVDALQDLVSLKLNPYGWNGSGITLEGLSRAVERWNRRKRLEVLGLALDATAMTATEFLALRPRGVPSLSSLKKFHFAPDSDFGENSYFTDLCLGQFMNVKGRRV
ncbi:hypothetical protein CONPUDRAFT_70386 [Coniophora puteana RWD-64-598 SS2]|uniref:F-box domain-containing protein n=1 Tax=Coniophora puteana (strain RWD-64-598) TaxID=741705 RepID=A0A5M3N442_CONPW|nr:uncharacterized protein CONPUDRAFT_70386 [Coniophora puteana RWD-64-598 SS2]EIW85625.1 hypothetical protein CONPUDRAFT_70386 [Coniophora puteana RWD-64-598 SS2]